MKTNTWYILAKKDNRYKYGYNILLKPKKYIYKELSIAKQKRDEIGINAVILKRTCELMEV